MKICIFGDSITYGAWDGEAGGWADRLKQYFMAKGGGNDVYNLGVPGDTTVDLLERVDVEARVRTRDQKFDAIIFAVGLNDTRQKEKGGEPEIDREEFTRNITGLLSQSADYTDTTIFVGLTPIDQTKTNPVSWKDAYYDETLISEYDVILKSVAESNGSKFVGVAGLLSDSMLTDGLHPNAEGHKKIFEAVRDVLEGL